MTSERCVAQFLILLLSCAPAARKVRSTTSSKGQSLVTLEITVTGNGAVSVDPLGKVCSNECELRINAGERVILRPVRDNDFLGWDACPSLKKEACVFGAKDARIAAIFRPSVNVFWTRILESNASDWGFAAATGKDGGPVALADAGAAAQWDQDTLPVYGAKDIVVFKLGPDGARQWAKTLGSPENDRAADLAGDGKGGVFLVASLRGGALDGEQVLPGWYAVKLSESDGSHVWHRMLPKNVKWQPQAISDGTDFYVVADTPMGSTLLVRLSGLTGQVVWTSQIEMPKKNPKNMLVRRQVALNDGLLYIAGEVAGKADEKELVVVSIKAQDGVEQWRRSLWSPSHVQLGRIRENRERGMCLAGTFRGSVEERSSGRQLLAKEAVNQDGLLYCISGDGQLQEFRRAGTSMHIMDFVIRESGMLVIGRDERSDKRGLLCFVENTDGCKRPVAFSTSPWFAPFRLVRTDRDDIVYLIGTVRKEARTAGIADADVLIARIRF